MLILFARFQAFGRGRTSSFYHIIYGKAFNDSCMLSGVASRFGGLHFSLFFSIKKGSFNYLYLQPLPSLPILLFFNNQPRPLMLCTDFAWNSGV